MRNNQINEEIVERKAGPTTSTRTIRSGPILLQSLQSDNNISQDENSGHNSHDQIKRCPL